tara:strand:- start:120 stop:902 length:783 start_codon:yes stop_codon:yes gene_type:complete
MSISTESNFSDQQMATALMVGEAMHTWYDGNRWEEGICEFRDARMVPFSAMLDRAHDFLYENLPDGPPGGLDVYDWEFVPTMVTAFTDVLHDGTEFTQETVNSVALDIAKYCASIEQKRCRFSKNDDDAILRTIANRHHTVNPYTVKHHDSESDYVKRIIDIGSLCVYCGHDTAFGSGRFVNRIPASTDECAGYACADCMSFECDRCGELIGMDEDIAPWMVYGEKTEKHNFDDGNYRVHMECLTSEEDKIWERTIEREG